MITELEKWILEKHKCEKCGKVMTEKFASGRFCSRSCANSRTHSKETKEKIGNTIHNNKKQQYNKNPNFCEICGKKLPYEFLRRRKHTCSDECYSKLLSIKGVNSGKASANSQNRRSKNEIAFAEKCIKYFGSENVLCNEPIFNGWDADIILLNYKIAILWNGIWHYKQISKQQSLIQVQSRDRLKLKEIESMGYIPFVIKDTGKYNLRKVDDEFNNLIKFINA